MVHNFSVVVNFYQSVQTVVHIHVLITGFHKISARSNAVGHTYSEYAISVRHRNIIRMIAAEFTVVWQ